MMKTPRERAARTTSLSGPAISLTRRAADLHQWSSHMSQMMRTVFFDSQATLRSATVKPSLPAVLTRVRRFSCRAPSAALVVEANGEVPSNAPRTTVVGQVFTRATSLYGPTEEKRPDRIPTVSRETLIPPGVV